MKYISIVFIICSSLLIAGERTGTKYFFNAGLNYNMHTTDIKGFLTDIEKKNITLIKRYEKYADEYGDEYGR